MVSSGEVLHNPKHEIPQGFFMGFLQEADLHQTLCSLAPANMSLTYIEIMNCVSRGSSSEVESVIFIFFLIFCDDVLLLPLILS